MLKILFVLSFDYILTINPCEGRESLLTDKILSTRLEQGNVNMKLIPLSQQGKHKGKYFAKVSDEDYDLLIKYRWRIFIANGTFYYAATGKMTDMIFMHRFILGVTDPKKFVDHIDHDGLNNQRTNIREATNLQNSRNRRPCGKSKYLGVFKSSKNRWMARIAGNGDRIYLGVFKCPEEAARAYDARAEELYGEFANLNFKNQLNLF